MKRSKYFLKFLHVANIQAAVNGQRTGARLDWVQFVGSKNNICLCVFDIYAFGEFFFAENRQNRSKGSYYKTLRAQLLRYLLLIHIFGVLRAASFIIILYVEPQCGKLVMTTVAGPIVDMQPPSRDSRQRRRKNRRSRDLDDQNAESVESPSDRIPLQETVDGERAGHASNSGEGSSGIPQDRRNRNRRPRRRSRMENGEIELKI